MSSVTETLEKSWRTNGSGHRVGLRSGEGKPQFFRCRANGREGCSFQETEATGQQRGNHAGPRLDFFFGESTSRSKAKVGRIQPIQMHRVLVEKLRSRANWTKDVSGRVTWLR